MDKTLVGLLMIFFLAFIIFMTFVIFNGQLTTGARASSQIVSASSSLIFAWPLSLKADGKTASEITVFVRSDEGKGIANRTVRLSTTVGTIQEANGVTDAAGKTLFHITSTAPGVAEIQTVVDNNPITKKVSIKFE